MICVGPDERRGSTHYFSTVTITDFSVVPPAALRHRTPNVDVWFRVTLAVPRVARSVANPMPTHAFASCDDQLKVTGWPGDTADGFATRVTVGKGTTVTVTDFSVLPPAPFPHVTRKVDVAFGVRVAVPFVALRVAKPAPQHVFEPCDDQFKATGSPGVTVVRSATKVNVGRGTAVTVTDCSLALPTALRHVTVNVDVA